LDPAVRIEPSSATSLMQGREDGQVSARKG
jgi:hypothetical protein